MGLGSVGSGPKVGARGIRRANKKCHRADQRACAACEEKKRRYLSPERLSTSVGFSSGDTIRRMVSPAYQRRLEYVQQFAVLRWRVIFVGALLLFAWLVSLAGALALVFVLTGGALVPLAITSGVWAIFATMLRGYHGRIKYETLCCPQCGQQIGMKTIHGRDWTSCRGCRLHLV